MFYCVPSRNLKCFPSSTPKKRLICVLYWNHGAQKLTAFTHIDLFYQVGGTMDNIEETCATFASRALDMPEPLKTTHQIDNCTEGWYFPVKNLFVL